MARVVDEPPEAQADAARDTESMRAPFRRLSLRAWVPYAVLAITLSLTVVGTAYVVRTNDTRDVLRFRAAAEETQQLIDIRLNTYIELLRAGAALFAATDNLTGDEFRAFVRGLRVHERYPGIQAIGFAVRIEPARLRAVESQLAAIANAHAQVWPPGARDEYVVTLLLEPLDRDNRLALGYDMAADPIRRGAMERARDTGEPAASGKVTLAQPSDASEQSGFVIFIPSIGMALQRVLSKSAVAPSSGTSSARTGWTSSSAASSPPGPRNPSNSRCTTVPHLAMPRGCPPPGRTTRWPMGIAR
jgi:CHASE1-domain containing sensor protein